MKLMVRSLLVLTLVVPVAVSAQRSRVSNVMQQTQGQRHHASQQLAQQARAYRLAIRNFKNEIANQHSEQLRNGTITAGSAITLVVTVTSLVALRRMNTGLDRMRAQLGMAAAPSASLLTRTLTILGGAAGVVGGGTGTAMGVVDLHFTAEQLRELHQNLSRVEAQLARIEIQLARAQR